MNRQDKLGWHVYRNRRILASESDVAYEARTAENYRSLTVVTERIHVRSHIPQEVQDEITAATRNAQPQKAARSVIYLYFIWTDNGIKLHWRLKHSRLDGRFVSLRESGDEIKQAASL